MEDSHAAPRAPASPSSKGGSVKGSTWKRTQGKKTGRREIPSSGELWYIVRTHPLTVIIPFLVFAVGVVVGVFVIQETEHVREETSRTSAQNVAIQAAQSVELQLASLIQPVLALKVFIRQGVNNYTALKEIYANVSADLLVRSQGKAEQDYGQQLQLAPQGNITDVYPYNDVTKQAIGVHLIDLEIRRKGTLAILEHEKVALSVIKFIQGPLAFRILTAVYIDNVAPDYNFSQPWPVSKFCPQDLCYKNATRKKFWGTITGAFWMDALLSDPAGPIQKLASQGYRYKLLQRGNAPALPLTEGYGNYTLLSRSTSDVDKPVTVVIDLAGGYQGFVPWELSVSPESGWESSVAKPMYAVVVIVSALVAVLLFAVLVSRVQNQALLFALVPKHVVDTLKSRHQYYSATAAVDVLATSTPAEVMLDLLSRCLEGELPSVTTVVQLRAALLSLQDLYRPANMSQALEALDLDSDVVGALMKVLNGSVRDNKSNPKPAEPVLEEGEERGSTDELMRSMSDNLSVQEVVVNMVLGKKRGLIKIRQDRQDSQMSLGANSCSSSIVTDTEGAQSKDMCVFEPASGKSVSELMARKSSLLFEDSKAVANSLVEPVWSELHVMLEEGWTSWTWDAFQMQKLTDGHALSTLAFFILHRTGLMQQLGISQFKVARFLSALEQSYNPAVPYHSSRHAADVLQTMHVIISRAGLVPGYADPIRHLACLLAAAAHDVEHTGLTNDFLINTESPLAIRYSDRSPMESHHLATMFTLLKQPEHDFVKGLPKEQRDTLRKTIIELVLGTDMKQHMTITSQFKSVHHQGQKAGSNKPSTSGDFTAPGHGEAPVVRIPVDETERTLSLQMALKLADLGHLAESHEVAMQWVDVLEEEFFQQGDQERQLGLPISPLFDRSKPGASKSQVGFYSFVALPIFQSFVQVFPEAKPFLQGAEENFRYWKGVTVPSTSGRGSIDNPNLRSSVATSRGSPSVPTLPPAPTAPVIPKV